jgi:hypothetical protein
MEYFIVGIVTALNFLFIKKKFELKRYEDAIFDIALFVVILFLFAGSFGGMVVGMIASLLISVAFFFSPPKLFSSSKSTKTESTATAPKASSFNEFFRIP